MDAPGGPVTTTVTRRVKPGQEALYAGFLVGIISAAREFPGHLGVEVSESSDSGPGLLFTGLLSTNEDVERFDAAAEQRFKDQPFAIMSLVMVDSSPQTSPATRTSN